MTLGRSIGAGLTGLLVLCAVNLHPVNAQAPDKIRVLFPTWTGFASVFVADDLGYYKEQGLTVDAKFEDERPNVMAAMARGDIECDMRSVPEYQGRPRDPTTPGVIIGVIDQSLGGDGVIASGAIKGTADLKGKTVASEPNIPARLLLQIELKKNGMTLNDVIMKDINTADTVPVFSDPSIDAIITFEPFLSQTLEKLPQRKPHVIVSSRDYPGVVTDAIIVRQDDLKANPKKYEKFLIGIYRATAYFATNRADYMKRAAPHFNLTVDQFEASIKGSIAYVTFAQARAFLGVDGTPGTLYPIFDDVMKLNLENGSADHLLTRATSFDTRAIAAIPPDRIPN